MPKDGALNSRCIVIPLHETTRQDLLRTNDPKIIEAAEVLQARLLVFRLFHYRRLRLPQIAGVERLRSRDRDLYEALALPIAENPNACAHLLKCFTYHQELDREPLPPSENAVIEGLFREIHRWPDQHEHALHSLRVEVNKALGDAGERFRLNERVISGVLRTLGFDRRKRTREGYIVVIDRDARKCVHTLLRTYGVRSPSTCLEELAPCEFCQPDAPTTQDPSTGPAAGESPKVRDSNGSKSSWKPMLQNPDELRQDWMDDYDGCSDEELLDMARTPGDDGGATGWEVSAYLRWRSLKLGPAFLRKQPPATPCTWTIPKREDVEERGRRYPPPISATWEREFGNDAEIEQLGPLPNSESDSRDEVEQKNASAPGRPDSAIKPSLPEAHGVNKDTQIPAPDQRVEAPSGLNAIGSEHREQGERENGSGHRSQGSVAGEPGLDPQVEATSSPHVTGSDPNNPKQNDAGNNWTGDQSSGPVPIENKRRADGIVPTDEERIGSSNWIESSEDEKLIEWIKNYDPPIDEDH